MWFLLNLINSISASPFFHTPNPGSQGYRRWETIPKWLICFNPSSILNRITIQNYHNLYNYWELSWKGALTGHFQELAGWRPLWGLLRPHHRPPCPHHYWSGQNLFQVQMLFSSWPACFVRIPLSQLPRHTCWHRADADTIGGLSCLYLRVHVETSSVNYCKCCPPVFICF